MSEKRLVECQDCGYRWESSADRPRCSKSACGRSRNVEAVHGDDGDQDDGDDEAEPELGESEDDEGNDDSGSTDDGGSDDSTPESSENGGSDGFTPTFETVESGWTPGESDDDGPDLDAPDLEEHGDEDRADEDDGDQEDGDDEEEADPAEEVPELEPEQLEVAFGTTFDLLANQRGDYWELDDDEQEKLAKAWCPVANQYAPHLLRTHTPVAIAAVCTVSIVAPRLQEDRERAKLEAAEERAERDGEPGSVRRAAETDSPDPEEDSEQAEAATSMGGYSDL